MRHFVLPTTLEETEPFKSQSAQDRVVAFARFSSCQTMRLVLGAVRNGVERPTPMATCANPRCDPPPVPLMCAVGSVCTPGATLAVFPRCRAGMPISALPVVRKLSGAITGPVPGSAARSSAVGALARSPRRTPRHGGRTAGLPRAGPLLACAFLLCCRSCSPLSRSQRSLPRLAAPRPSAARWAGRPRRCVREGRLIAAKPYRPFTPRGGVRASANCATRDAAAQVRG